MFDHVLENHHKEQVQKQAEEIQRKIDFNKAVKELRRFAKEYFSFINQSNLSFTGKTQLEVSGFSEFGFFPIIILLVDYNVQGFYLIGSGANQLEGINENSFSERNFNSLANYGKDLPNSMLRTKRTFEEELKSRLNKPHGDRLPAPYEPW